MSKYTTEVRYICETLAGLDESKGYNSINTIIDQSMDKIFDFDYPIFDPSYKRILQRKILKHYYTREIGLETVGLWKHFLDMKLNEIMPYYNKMYMAETLDFNPLYDVDMTTTRKTDGETAGKTTTANQEAGTQGSQTTTDNSTTGTKAFTENYEDNIDTTNTLSGTDRETKSKSLGGSDTTTSTLSGSDRLSRATTDSGTEGETTSDVKKNTRWDIYSDTPQGALTNVQNENYLTNARKITDDGTGTTASKTTTFGKTVNQTDTTTYGKVDTDVTQYGQTIGENNATIYGKTSTDEGTNTGEKTGEETTQANTQEQTRVNASHTTNGTSEKNDNILTTEDFIEHVYGKTSGTSFSKMLAEYRENLINIDMMIIDELNGLFFNLW